MLSERSQIQNPVLYDSHLHEATRLGKSTDRRSRAAGAWGRGHGGDWIDGDGVSLWGVKNFLK